MKLERIADALVFVVVILFLAFMAGAFQPPELELDSYEATPTAFELLAERVFAFGRKMLATYREGPGGPARSPWWYENHCEYVELDPLDLSPDVPDGIYVNCR